MSEENKNLKMIAHRTAVDDDIIQCDWRLIDGIFPKPLDKFFYICDYRALRGIISPNHDHKVWQWEVKSIYLTMTGQGLYIAKSFDYERNLSLRDCMNDVARIFHVIYHAKEGYDAT